jgi:transketolase
MHVFAPAFAFDLVDVIPKMAMLRKPAYLRLGRCEKPRKFDIPDYAPWRKMLSGEGPVILAVGPLVGGLISSAMKLLVEDRPEVWLVSELPIEDKSVPQEFINALSRKRKLLVVEEHVSQGGVGQIIALFLMANGKKIDIFEHVCALGYPSGNYGSQQFHRIECGLNSEEILKRIRAWN